jgi:hypothetical protein
VAAQPASRPLDAKPHRWGIGSLQKWEKGEQRIPIRFLWAEVIATRTLAKQHDRSCNGDVIWVVREYLEQHNDGQ